MRRASREAGFTLLEAVVAVALGSLLLIAIYTMFSAAWRTESAALTVSELQHEARGLLYSVVNGSTGPPAARGLMEADAVLTDGTALAYRWTDPSRSYGQMVKYYLAGTTVYRAVVDFVVPPPPPPPLPPLTIQRSGGTPVAEHITTFRTSLAATPTTAVVIDVTGVIRDRQVNLSTSCKPRNIPVPR